MRFGRLLDAAPVPCVGVDDVVDLAACGHPPAEAFARELVRGHVVGLLLHGGFQDQQAERRIGLIPALPVGDVADLVDRPFGPRHAVRSGRGLVADAAEHDAGRVLVGRCTGVDGLRVGAGGLRGQEAGLLFVGQLLRLVEDQQVAVLAASAVAGARQEFDLRAGFEDDGLASQCGADRLDVFAQAAAVEEVGHVLERFGRGLLQVAGVQDQFVLHEHPVVRPGLGHAQGLAVLPRHGQTARARRPQAIRVDAEPAAQHVLLPAHRP